MLTSSSPAWPMPASRREIAFASISDPGAPHNGADNGACYFGRGRHSCLGEDLSNWLWRTLTVELARLPLYCTIESEVRGSRNGFFNYHSNIIMRFHA